MVYTNKTDAEWREIEIRKRRAYQLNSAIDKAFQLLMKADNPITQESVKQLAKTYYEIYVNIEEEVFGKSGEVI